MSSLLSIMAPIALALPLGGTGGAVIATDDAVALDPRQAPLTQSVSEEGNRERLEALYDIPVQRQVRIEQRVVVRVSPKPPSEPSPVRNSLMAELPPRAAPPRMVERPMPKCVAVKSIAGVQTGSGNQLYLFTAGRKTVSARLEKSCRARDFYSGFYLEKNEDGMLCVDRDKLQSRTGAKCELTRMRELVAANP